jgi:hypothetical protein
VDRELAVLPGGRPVLPAPDALLRAGVAKTGLPADVQRSPAVVAVVPPPQQSDATVVSLVVNGEPCGVRAWADWHFDIGDQLRNGMNQIEFTLAGVPPATCWETFTTPDPSSGTTTRSSAKHGIIRGSVNIRSRPLAWMVWRSGTTDGPDPGRESGEAG